MVLLLLLLLSRERKKKNKHRDQNHPQQKQHRNERVEEEGSPKLCGWNRDGRIARVLLGGKQLQHKVEVIHVEDRALQATKHGLQNSKSPLQS